MGCFWGSGAVHTPDAKAETARELFSTKGKRNPSWTNCQLGMCLNLKSKGVLAWGMRRFPQDDPYGSKALMQRHERPNSSHTMLTPNPWDPSIQILPTLGPEVCEYYTYTGLFESLHPYGKSSPVRRRRRPTWSSSNPGVAIPRLGFRV